MDEWLKFIIMDNLGKNEYNNFHRVNAYQVKPKMVVPCVSQVIADENNKVVVVKFNDGTKEVVKTQDGDQFDVYIGVALAMARRQYKSTTSFRKMVDNNLVVVSKKNKKVNTKTINNNNKEIKE